jgi:glutathione synthase/RimK-type ligase-like ATP-grasp enzyme
MLLIVTERLDPHTDFLEEELRRRQLEWFRLHLSDFPVLAGGTVGLTSEGDPHGWIELASRRLELSQVTSIWYRRTEAFGIPDLGDAALHRFAAAECLHFMREVWTSLARARWVSTPEAIRAASTKFEQLLRASRYGFRVPQTMITNRREDVLDFVAQLGGAGEVIYKPHTSLIIPVANNGDVGVAYTTPLSAELLERLDEVRLTPGIFQQRIRKKRDLRVTIFDTTAFVVGIESQAHPETVDDWRASSWTGPPPKHVTMQISQSLTDACVSLVRSYGLRFGAIDLIEDSGGNYWFLELNPNGQWAWIERETGLPMRQALVNLLIEEEK